MLGRAVVWLVSSAPRGAGERGAARPCLQSPACRAARLCSRVALAAAGAAAPETWGDKPPLQLAERCCFSGGAVSGTQADLLQAGFGGCSDVHQEFARRPNAYFHKEVSRLWFFLLASGSVFKMWLQRKRTEKWAFNLSPAAEPPCPPWDAKL